MLNCINHSGSRNVCFDLWRVAFKLKMAGIVPWANNSITQWHFLVEGTGDKEQRWGGAWRSEGGWIINKALGEGFAYSYSGGCPCERNDPLIPHSWKWSASFPVIWLRSKNTSEVIYQAYYNQYFFHASPLHSCSQVGCCCAQKTCAAPWGSSCCVSVVHKGHI